MIAPFTAITTPPSGSPAPSSREHSRGHPWSAEGDPIPRMKPDPSDHCGSENDACRKPIPGDASRAVLAGFQPFRGRQPWTRSRKPESSCPPALVRFAQPSQLVHATCDPDHAPGMDFRPIISMYAPAEKISNRHAVGFARFSSGLAAWARL